MAELDRTTRPLSRTDAKELAQTSTFEHAMVEPESSFDSWARRLGKRKRVALVSGNQATLSLYRLTVGAGRALDDDDRREGRRVCVVGREVYDDLLKSPGGAESLRGVSLADLRLEISGTLFSVVGVLEKKPMFGATDSTYLWDRKVMIPSTTYDALYATSHDVTRIYVRKPLAVSTREMLAPVRAAVHATVLRRHLGVSNFAPRRTTPEAKTS